MHIVANSMPAAAAAAAADMMYTGGGGVYVTYAGPAILQLV